MRPSTQSAAGRDVVDEQVAACPHQGADRAGEQVEVAHALHDPACVREVEAPALKLGRDGVELRVIRAPKAPAPRALERAVGGIDPRHARAEL